MLPRLEPRSVVLDVPRVQRQVVASFAGDLQQLDGVLTEPGVGVADGHDRVAGAAGPRGAAAPLSRAVLTERVAIALARLEPAERDDVHVVSACELLRLQGRESRQVCDWDLHGRLRALRLLVERRGFGAPRHRLSLIHI